MFKNKAETDVRRSRGSVIRKSKDEVERELNTDKSNLKKEIKNNDTKKKPNSTIREPNVKTNNLMSGSKSEYKISRKETSVSEKNDLISSTIKKSIVNKGTKLTSRDVTSNRVTKTQYFPKKYPFSSYLHEEKNEKPTVDSSKSLQKYNLPLNRNTPNKKLIKEQISTKILSPNKKKTDETITDNELKDERPRTATIQKGFSEILEQNAKSLNSSTTLTKIENTAVENASNVLIDECEYEDDFESYESDFEQCSSTSSEISLSTDSSSTEENNTFTSKQNLPDETKLDSGNYDLSDVKHKQILDKIREAIECENSEFSNKNRSNMASLSDEGFEDSMKLSLNINFADARKKQQEQRIEKKKQKRGEELMNMIRLDSVSFSLLDMQPMSYEAFMKTYGCQNTIQASSQTGNDDVDEEIQTEKIQYSTKSTQYPIRFSNYDIENNLDEQLGIINNDSTTINQLYDSNNSRKLEKFVHSAGELILHILEQKSSRIEEHTFPSKDVPFSDGYFKLNVEPLPFLQMRSVTSVEFHKNMLLTVHEGNIQMYMNANEQMLSRPLILVWNLLEPNRPKFILASSGEISKVCFDNSHGCLVFGGIKDGTISVWDLRESSAIHQAIYDEDLDEHITMYSAAYTTTVQCLENESEIVAIQTINIHDDTNNNFEKKSNLQICALSDTATVTLWNVIEEQDITKMNNLTWSPVMLVQCLKISLQHLNPELKELQCYDMKCSEKDSQHLYIASNYGVLHCMTTGMKPNPKIYEAKTDIKSDVNCIEMCPFSAKYFLAGTNNGNVLLYSCLFKKSLMNFTINIHSEKIQIVQWSQTRPAVFYVKDDGNCIHVWDLAQSDLYPIYTVPFKEKITAIKLSPILKYGNERSYMAVSTESGKIYLYTINDTLQQYSSDDFNIELKKFLNYINRL